MVIDGLDSPRVAKEIKPLLPISSSGQILVTARDRECLGDICNWKCREIKPPELEVCLNIFRLHLKPEYDDEDLQGTYRLLETLWLPLVIKMAATYMNKKQKPNRDMREDLRNHGFQQIVRFGESEHMKFMKYFLQPLTLHRPNGKRKSRQKPEMNLLCFLACLSKDKIGRKLINANYEDQAKLNDTLSNLMNRAFIEKVGDNSYRMHKFVQDGVIAWIRETYKEKGLFDCLAAALGAIYKRYNEKKQYELGEKAHLQHRSSYEWKVPFMPHFARFVDFTRDAKRGELSDFQFHIGALECIETFSRVYINEGQPQGAVEVLEFARAHFEKSCSKGDVDSVGKSDGSHGPNGDNRGKIDDSTIKGIATKTRLVRTLADAYALRGHDRDISQAEHLLVGQLGKVKELRSQIPIGYEAEYKMLHWELQLDLVRLYSESGRFVRAQEVFRSLELLDLHDTKSEIGFRFRYEKRLLPLFKTSWNVKKRTMLIVIRRKQYQGLLYLATGKEHAKKGWPWSQWQATQSWKAAKRALSDARGALEQWRPSEKEYLVDIESSIAEINLQLAKLSNNDQLLHETEEMLIQHIKDLSEKAMASENRMWEAERKLAEVRIEGNRENIQDTIEKLTYILKAYDTRYGKGSDWTHSYAHLLSKAYQKIGRRDEVRRLQETYKLPPEFNNDLSPQRRIGMEKFTSTLLISSIAILCFFTLVWRGRSSEGNTFDFISGAVQTIQFIAFLILMSPRGRRFLGMP